MRSPRSFVLALGALTGFVVGCRSDFTGECPVGTEDCPCTENGACGPGLECLSNTCVADDGETGDTQSDAGDGDTQSNTGDGDTSTGDGDTSTGDGDTSTGDGDTSTGDGDTSTGDGDASTGDGDGDGEIDPPDTPELRTPIQDAYVGSAHASSSLRPRFTWTEVDLPAGASSLDYEIEYGTDPAFATSDNATVSGTAWQPVDGLPVSVTQPVGDRYYWRVRACADSSTCSDFTDARWVNVGRPKKDVDGDGYPDLLASTPDGTNSNGIGSVQIHRGGQGAGFDTSSDWTLNGDFEGYRYGRDVVAADVNGDGYADPIVGSWGVNDRGRLHVHLSTSNGPTTASFVEFNDRVAINSGHYAWVLANLGDVNGDGYSDFVAGEEGSNSIDGNFPGYVHVYLGSASFNTSATRIELEGVSDDDRFGASVAGADVNGDGLSDLIVGAPLRAGGGAVYVYLGESGGVASVPWATLTATGSTEFGATVAHAGDVNGDGYADILVGDEAGLAAHIFFGAADPITGQPDHSVSGPVNSLFARDVAGGGDMDRDGYSEFVIGAPGWAIYNSGAVLIWRGGLNLQAQADGQFNHFNENSGETGAVLGLARDTNGDGFVEIPAARGYSYSGVYVFLGEGTLSYDDDPPLLNGSVDYGYAIY